MNSLHWDSMICDHHVNKNIWTPFVLHVEQEMHNAQDCFTVAVMKDGIMASWPYATWGRPFEVHTLFGILLSMLKL